MARDEFVARPALVASGLLLRVRVIDKRTWEKDTEGMKELVSRIFQTDFLRA
jgi:hypothetical protein